MLRQEEKTTATLMHLSALAKYLFPLAGIIVPLLIWQSKKSESEFVNENGKKVLNFQLSLLLYTIVALLILSFFSMSTIIDYIKIELEGGTVAPVELLSIIMVALVTFGLATLGEFILIIHGTLKANEGYSYQYPLSIPFLK